MIGASLGGVLGLPWLAGWYGWVYDTPKPDLN